MCLVQVSIFLVSSSKSFTLFYMLNSTNIQLALNFPMKVFEILTIQYNLAWYFLETLNCFNVRWINLFIWSLIKVIFHLLVTSPSYFASVVDARNVTGVHNIQIRREVVGSGVNKRYLFSVSKANKMVWFALAVMLL